MNDLQFGRLSKVDLREVWRNEAADFTPWLLRNVSELNAALGLEVELQAAEHPVGSFSLDLIGTITGTNEVVIVENQLEPSNHTHLGQLLTYAGGTDANVVIWVAKSFREEHLAAIRWLNDGTTEELKFFAVEVSAVRIGDSAVAPVLSVVAHPNEWSREVKSAARSSLSGTRGALQLSFWRKFLETVKVRHPDWTRWSDGRPQSWLSFGSGRAGATYSFVFTSSECRVEFGFWSSNKELNDTRFRYLEAQKEAIEKICGQELEWHNEPDQKSAIIRLRRPGNIDDETTWKEAIEWMISKHAKFREAIGPLTADLPD